MITVHSHLTPAADGFPPELREYVAQRTAVHEDHYVIGGGDYSLKIRHDPDTEDEGGLGKERYVGLMDTFEIDHMVLSVSPLSYNYWAPPEPATRLNRLHNDVLADFCADDGRFSFVATLPMHDPGAALDEFDRMVTDGDARGLVLSTDSLAGRELDDEAFWPVYERAAAEDVPIFLHPHPWPYNEAATGEVDDLSNAESVVTGYLYGESRSFVRLVLGGVLDAFPGLTFVLPHGGGAIPYQLGRVQRAAEKMFASAADRPIDAYLENFYFDLTVHDRAAREFLIDTVGLDRVLPPAFPSWDVDDPGVFYEDLALDADERHQVLEENPRRVFGL